MYILGYTGYTRDSRISLGNRSPLAKTNQGFENIFSFRDREVPFSMFPLGFLGHDASAAIIKDGEIIACAAEERFIRVKHSLNLAGNTMLPTPTSFTAIIFAVIRLVIKTATVITNQNEYFSSYTFD